MSRSEIAEHAGYLRDEVKLGAYRAALAEVVQPGDRVLDLGAGTGILGLLALEAGAGIVYSVDAGPILEIVEAAARANGYDGRVIPVRGYSTRLELDTPVDVVVADQIGGGGHDSGMLTSFADASRRLLAPGGRFVPASFEVLLAPVQTPFWDTHVGIWDRRPGGVDLSAMATVASNTEFRVELTEAELLTEPTPTINLLSACTDPYEAVCSAVVERPGILHGMAAMFVAQMAPGVTLSNVPGRPDRFDRWQNLYPLRTPVEVEPGHVVRCHLDVRPATYLVTWTITVASPDGTELARHRASTALGCFMTPADLAVTTGAAVPRRTEWLRVQQAVLDRVDGVRSLREIVELTYTEHPGAFTDHLDAEQRIASLLHRSLPGV